ncbi:hypothetical protein ASD71_21155 [Achromobacter sp. Root565]|nr:response regulator transcription factor [Achromobacter sp. Root565]KQZ99378.1 hypothetical protein ASD71_21155 [Achromobacter sp. Root565]
MGGRLAPFRIDCQAHGTTQHHDRVHDGGRVAAFANVGHEAAVDLDLVDGESLQITQAGRAGSKIVRREKTVKTHVSAILGTLGVLNRTQATLVARRGGVFGKPV